MAMVNFKKGLLSALPTTFAEGTFYVTTDEHALYLDVSGSERIRISDFQKVANMASLPAASAAVAPIYYIEDINCLAVHNGNEWIQVNRDTGMTSVEVVGEGNAVTAAIYSADGRKLTLTKGATYMTGADVDTKINAKVGEIPADSEGAAQTVRQYIDAKTAGIATEGAMTELTGRVTVAEGDIGKLEGLVGDTAVATQITNAINALDKPDTPVANQYVSAVSEDNGVITVSRETLPDYSETYDAKGAAATAEKNAKDHADSLNTAMDGRVAALEGIDHEAYKAYADQAETDAIAAAKTYADDNKVASVAAGDASVSVGGTATNPTVAAKLSADADNAMTLAADGLKVVIPAAAEYSIVKDENSGDFAAVYHLTKGGANTGAAINIPKDMVVESGSVVTDPDGQPAGTYIKLVLQNVEEPLYINVGSLIEYVTSGSVAGDMVVIAVSDDHKVTATITDGSITLAKLSTEIQTAIGKAHTHENTDVLAGISATKVADWDDAVAKEHEHGNKSELDLIASGDKAKWDAAEAKAHEHANKAVLDGITEAKVSAWDAAEQNAKDYADGLAKNYDAAGSAASAQTAAQGYADQKIAALDKDDAAVAGEYVSAVSEADGVITVTRAALPVYEAVGVAATKAKEAQTAAEATAKAYTDTALTWGTF